MTMPRPPRTTCRVCGKDVGTRKDRAGDGTTRLVSRHRARPGSAENCPGSHALVERWGE